MRFPAECPDCRQVEKRRQEMYEVGSGPRAHAPGVLTVDFDYRNEADAADVHSEKLTLRCKEGHETVVALPIQAFELLFEFGCAALLDGYAREAVTSFASSFERFQEFTCRFLLSRRNLSFDRVGAWWKHVAISSERQLGSYVALWISEFVEPPPLLPPKLVQFRNECVHKGRIPPEGEAKIYGEAVLRAEVQGIVMLRNCFDSEYDYRDFVEDEISRPDVMEPDILGPLRGYRGHVPTLLDSMWHLKEPSQETWGGEPDDAPTKNTTDPARLTMDRALSSFRALRGFGMRQK